MSEEQVGRLFQRFTQAERQHHAQVRGHGLGLALTKAFAELMGGEVIVASEPGRGTRFTLVVPASLPEAAARRNPTSRARGFLRRGRPWPRPGHRRRGQPAGPDGPFPDEAGLRGAYRRRRRTGLDLARSLTPRVILLDVMMPEIDGWAVLATLKGRRGDP